MPKLNILDSSGHTVVTENVTQAVGQKLAESFFVYAAMPDGSNVQITDPNQDEALLADELFAHAPMVGG